MRIAYIASSQIPSRSANSVHVMKMCQSFARAGHEVVLLVPNRAARESGGDPYAFYGVENCFTIVRRAWPGARGGSHVFGYLAARYARELGVDVVYSRSLPAAYFAALLKQWTVLELHTPVVDKGPLCEWMFRRLVGMKHVRRLVVITNALKRYLAERYRPCQVPMLVAPDGADAVQSVPQAVSRSGRMQVGYVGHLYPGKGMEVVANLARRCGYADFGVVGGLQEDIDFWSKELAGVRNIRFHGYKPHAEIENIIHDYDVLLLPNQKRVHASGGGGDIGQWTSPLKLFEYMAAGKPILASDLPVLREVLVHERNCLLCSWDDPADWVRALWRLTNDPVLRQQLGCEARAMFLSMYTWDRRAERVIDSVL